MRLTVTLAAFLVIAISASAVFGQTTTREDFEDFCQIMQGRWLGEITLVTDMPGLGRAGEKPTAYVENRIIADGNAIDSVAYAGKGMAKWMTVWDAGSKQIRSLLVTSGGSTVQTVTSKKDGKWVEKRVGSKPDGSPLETKATLTISPDGDTHTWSGTTFDGVKTEDWQNVWKRVGK
ncbi:MAG: hypothetical protein H8E44_40450 [Planctomycetes bacterium]|nr:hypothetical protein [Planctomycetota bacterium]